jgi:16S rRNA G1207 methylase RsmC
VARIRQTDVAKLKEDIVFRANLRGRELVFRGTWGLFSPRRVDDGSRMLLDHVEVSPADVSIDLGCGYGPIGLAVAAECPRGEVHMVDKDYVALDFARRNAAANGLTNCRVYASNAFSEVDASLRFDNVLANLPAKVGAELLTIILHDARDRLTAGGQICVVTVTGLRKFIRRNFEEVFGNYDKLHQGPHYTVARAVKE